MSAFQRSVILHDMVGNSVNHKVDLDVIVIPFLSFRVVLVVDVTEDDDTITETSRKISLEKAVQCWR